jgi:hypothetical protein
MTSNRSTGFWLAHAVLVTALAAASTLAGCGGSRSSDGETPKTETAPEATPPGSSEPITQEACQAQGGRIAGDIGDGKVKCNEGEKEVGRVQLGIEGSLCCVPAGTDEPTAGGAAGGGGGW